MITFNRKGESRTTNQDRMDLEKCYSLYVTNVGKLQLVLIHSICVENLKESSLRDLWNIAITHLPSIETILFDS